MIDEKILQEITRRLVLNFNPNKIILFGSHARGDANIRSDVDILVIRAIDGKRRSIMVEMDRALRGIEIARDILVLTPEEFERDRHIPGTIARPASLEGKILYENS